jgi:FeS assembly SUF system protein
MAELNPIEKSLLQNEVVEAMREIYDPEIPVNIYDLGLIYNIDVSDDAHVHILMTLTSPMCPVAETLPGEVEIAASHVAGVKNATVELTWDPPFTMEMMSEDVKLMLGLI